VPVVKIFAEAITLQVNPLAWEIIPRLHLGPLAISPHGIGIALGYLVGAQLMVRRARRLEGPDESEIWNALFYALIGAIVGARVGYVLGHLSEVTDGGADILGIFNVWEESQARSCSLCHTCARSRWGSGVWRTSRRRAWRLAS
jgi:hypothetical protein